MQNSEASCRAELLTILRGSREDLIQTSTDIAFVLGETPVGRDDVEQMLRACIALVEEGLVGESTLVRSGFLDALADVAKTGTWDLTLKNGLPCWGVIIGQLVASTASNHRREAIQFLSCFMGAWWSDVSRVMLPVYLGEGRI